MDDGRLPPDPRPRKPRAEPSAALSQTDPRFLAPSIFAAAALLAGLLLFRLLPGEAPEIPDDAWLAAEIAYAPASFAELDGWASDDHAAALGAFARSCAARQTPVDADDPWGTSCAAALGLESGVDREAARAFFERSFRPVQIIARRLPRADGLAAGKPPLDAATGVFTGYFEPVYRGALSPTAELTAPVYPKPDDLVAVDLGLFRPEFRGQRIAGRIEGGALRPYADHAAINAGALAPRVAPIAYMDPNDLLFLQIQGSGRLLVEQADGGISEMRIGYDGQNGHPYTAIGKALVEQGVLPLDEVSMQSIRAWLAAAPEDAARTLREVNRSYVFFRELTALPDPALGPIGAEGVQLTPMRSLAVDRKFHDLGAPMWISLTGDETRQTPAIRQLMIAQDTGGAIRGPIRGDVFTGSGAEAGELAGRLRADGALFVLLPAALAEQRLSEAPAPRP